MPGFLIGKRSADNARRFMVDVAGRLVFPNAHASDAHSYRPAATSRSRKSRPTASRPTPKRLTWRSAPT